MFIIISFQIALCGMLISLAYCSAKDFRLIDDNNKKILFSKPVGVVCVIFSFVTLVVGIKCFVLSNNISMVYYLNWSAL